MTNVVARSRVLFRIDLTRFGLPTLANSHQRNKTSWHHRKIRCYCTDTTKAQEKSPNVVKVAGQPTNTLNNNKLEEVTVKYVYGLPQVTVPLPSRNELCQFTLRPVTHSVGDFLDMLRAEDRGIDRATILNDSGVRIAAASSVENLMGENFWLYINDRKYYVQPPSREKVTSEELTRLGDVRALVAQLYEALNVGEYQITKERELQGRLEKLNEQLGPLEAKKRELNSKALRRANSMAWLGLGLMSVQFGVLARLTWWEYSWDIMEPVTYFVTYGTSMACFAYFVLTKQDYLLPDVKDRQQLIALHKSAQKHGLDLTQYNNLKREIAVIEQDIRRLRDPLCLHLPVTPVKSPNYSETEISTAKKIKDFIAEATGTKDDKGGFTSKLQRSELMKISNLLQKLKITKK